MNAFAQIWGAILPVRWYMAVLLGQAARGLPLSESARPFAALAALAVLYTLLAFLRLRAIAPSMARSAPAPVPTAATAAPRGIGGAFAAEWRRVLALRGAFLMLVVAPLFGIFFVMALSEALILEGLLGIEFKGDVPMILAGGRC